MRPLAKRRLGRHVIFRTWATVDGRINGSIGEAVVHLMVMVVNVVMIGRDGDGIAVLTCDWFTIPDGTIMLYRIGN